MERAFGQDFSGVRAYMGRREPMEAIGAHAAANGEQIAFAEASPSRKLVAHELTHVVQRRRAGGGSGGVRGSMKLSQPGDAAEREAERVGEAVSTGTTGHVSATIEGGLTLSRKKKGFKYLFHVKSSGKDLELLDSAGRAIGGVATPGKMEPKHKKKFYNGTSRGSNLLAIQANEMLPAAGSSAASGGGNTQAEKDHDSLFYIWGHAIEGNHRAGFIRGSAIKKNSLEELVRFIKKRSFVPFENNRRAKWYSLAKGSLKKAKGRRGKKWTLKMWNINEVGWRKVSKKIKTNGHALTPYLRFDDSKDQVFPMVWQPPTTKDVGYNGTGAVRAILRPGDRFYYLAKRSGTQHGKNLKKLMWSFGYTMVPMPGNQFHAYDDKKVAKPRKRFYKLYGWLLTSIKMKKKTYQLHHSSG